MYSIENKQIYSVPEQVFENERFEIAFRFCCNRYLSNEIKFQTENIICGKI